MNTLKVQQLTYWTQSENLSMYQIIFKVEEIHMKWSVKREKNNNQKNIIKEIRKRKKRKEKESRDIKVIKTMI